MRKPNHAPGADLPDIAANPLDVVVDRRRDSAIELVRRAIAAGDVLLAFQPVIQARPPFDVGFYEGLIRVLDPNRRVIPARDFMAAVEDTELGRQLDCAALRLGMRALEMNPGLRLSINLSARSIGYKPWRRTFDRFLARDARLGERLVLEISQASAMRVPELVACFMDELQPHGVAFALDDFGASDIAIRHFRQMLFDLVKIDGTFVRGIDRDGDAQALTQALVAMARALDMGVVAVSVESRDEAEILRRLGVDCLQGYAFGAPSVRPPWLDGGDAQVA